MLADFIADNVDFDLKDEYAKTRNDGAQLMFSTEEELRTAIENPNTVVSLADKGGAGDDRNGDELFAFGRNVAATEPIADGVSDSGNWLN